MPNPAESAWLKRLGVPSRTAVPNGQNRTTTPNVPAAPIEPSTPNNRIRNAHLFMCAECGQSWHVEPAGGAFVSGPAAAPRFCPSCGAETLAAVPSAFGGLECGAIKQLRVERMLAQLLYEQWAANAHAEQQKHPRYVDYLRIQLQGA